jgi:hypothetical protein
LLEQRRTMKRWKRALGILAVTVATLALFYPVAGNLFLAFGLRRVATDLDYRSAWTVWPGRVHLKEFELHVQSDTVEWMLAAQAATVNLDLFALVHHEVHLREVRADGLRFRLRLRVMPEDAGDPKLLALPPIVPFDDPPIQVAGAPDPEILRGEYPYWVARIDESDARVTEIWIGPYRFQGEARSRGDFYVAPHRAIAMGPATLDVKDGAVTLAGDEVARGIEGRVTCAIDRFDPDTLRDRAILRAFTSTVRLEAQVPSLAFLGFYVPASHARFEDGSGALHADAGLLHGRLVAGSALELETDRIRTLLPSFEIVSSAKLDWRVPEGDDERTVLRARVPAASVWRDGVEVPPASITNASVSYTTAGSDLATELGFGGFSARAPRVHADDIRWLTKVHDGAPVRLDAGRTTLSGELEIDADHRAHGQATVAIAGAALVVKDSVLRGDIDATATVHGEDVVASRRLALEGGNVILSHAAVTRGKSRNYLGARADLEGGHLDFKSGFAFDLASHGLVTDTDAVLDLLGSPALSKAAADVFAAGMANADAKLAYADGLFTVKITQGKSGATHVQGEVRKRDDATEAAFVVGAGLLSLGVLIEHDHVTLVPEAGDHWLDAHRPRLAPHARGAGPVLTMITD